MPDAATKSTWNWNPKGAANAPAKIGQHETAITENETTNTPFSVPSEVPSSDPSRAAWLQGTIDTIHTSQPRFNDERIGYRLHSCIRCTWLATGDGAHCASATIGAAGLAEIGASKRDACCRISGRHSNDYTHH